MTGDNVMNIHESPGLQEAELLTPFSFGGGFGMILFQKRILKLEMRKRD